MSRLVYIGGMWINPEYVVRVDDGRLVLIDGNSVYFSNTKAAVKAINTALSGRYEITGSLLEWLTDANAVIDKANKGDPISNDYLRRWNAKLPPHSAEFLADMCVKVFDKGWTFATYKQLRWLESIKEQLS